MVNRRYVPDAGDLVWLDFPAPGGRPEAARRTALVISLAAYNGRAGLAVACPITTQAKGDPFEVALPAGLGVEGIILTDHLRSIDWRGRHSERAGPARKQVVADVLDRVVALLGMT